MVLGKIILVSPPLTSNKCYAFLNFLYCYKMVVYKIRWKENTPPFKGDILIWVKTYVGSLSSVTIIYDMRNYVAESSDT